MKMIFETFLHPGLVAFYAVYVVIVITGHLVHQRITALRDRKTGDTLCMYTVKMPIIY